MAVDGWVCQTRKPYVTEVDTPITYRNRKDMFGIVVMAGCSSDTRFMMFSCISSGSTNDVIAWNMSNVKNALDEGRLPPKYYFIGDEAFSNTNQFLVPWSGHGLDPWKDSFNFHLSSMRQCIERAFGILTQRWGIFWRPLRCDFRRWPLICITAAKLHNFCLDMNEGSDTILSRYDEDMYPGDEYNVVMNGNLNEMDDDNIAVRPTGDRRRNLTAMFEHIGVRRPNNAS